MERNKKKLEITQTISEQKIVKIKTYNKINNKLKKNKIMSHREFESRKNKKLKEIHDDLIKKTKLLSEKMAETTKQKYFNINSKIYDLKKFKRNSIIIKNSRKKEKRNVIRKIIS